MSDVTFDELMYLAERMAQDLQEYVDAGEKGGSDMTTSKFLLKEFEELRRRAGLSWMNQVSEGEIPEGLVDL